MKNRILERIYTNGKVEYICEEFDSGTMKWQEMITKAPLTSEIRPAIFDSREAAIEFLYSSKGEYIISENVIYEGQS